MTPEQVTLDQRRRRVLDALVNAGPEHFNMASWIATPDGDGYFNDYGLQQIRTAMPENQIEVFDDDGQPLVWDPNACGTTACLAGWCKIVAVRTDDHSKDLHDPADIADWLGIEDEMFYSGQWPDELVDHCHDLIAAGVSPKRAEYHVIIDFLVDLINHHRPTERSS